jgi:energy-coupling factor transporter ATP-binding protein EcfA2
MRSFRGVPDTMEVDFGEGQSLAVYGDNGTGKSTIADALEWYFTGGIELLSHEGRQHAIKNLGPAGGGETAVELVTSGGLGGRAVYPDERGAEAFGVASRETFLLRGRTLADFINKTKTEKWKALAELLGLDAVELLRQDLQRARSDIKKQVKAAEERIEAAARAIGAGDGKVSEDSVLQSLQQICRGLGVDVPDSLERVADPAWIAGIAGVGESTSVPRLEALTAAVAGLGPVEVDLDPIRGWNDLVSSEGTKDLARLTLFKDADALLASSPAPDRCPLCSQAVDGKKLSSHVREVLGGLLEASREMERIGEDARSCLDTLGAASETRRAIVAQAKALRIELPRIPSVAAALDARGPIDLAPLEALASEIERWDRAAREEVAKSAPASGGTRQSQLGLLAALLEQIRVWRAAQKDLVQAKKAYDLADRIYDAYLDRQKAQLEQMLKSISQRVAELYSALHPGEELGGITVEPWTAKGLELAIDFHGSRQRPPHGVLSESHLNSLAIALFLAMAQTFNQRLRFLVLDDVINSFDLEHRGQLAELLAEKFDDWQLIVLTHDRQFFEHLTRRAPGWKRLEITSWSYDEGPRTTKYSSPGILAEASERLAEGDVNGAATKARRALEELLQEVCEALRAELPFRRGTRNDQREIGELLKGIRRGVKEHAKGMLEGLEPLLKNLEADVQASLNVEAHASRGRAASSEIEAALRRIEELDRMWSCPDCGTRVWHKGTPESSRCKCGKSLFPPKPPS